MKPISVQLYSLREECKEDFVGVLKRLAETGYKGVEPAGFWGLEPAEVKRIVTDLGMVISSTHSPWANPENLDEVIDVAGTLGIDMVAAGYGRDAFPDMDAIKGIADTLNPMVEKLSAAGLTLVLHNHWWEFEELDGRLKWEILAELAPGLQFELDTYWASCFGANDVPALLKQYQDRCPLLHIKDGPLVRDEPNTAVGAGKMDIAGVINAAGDTTKWHVVELDRCGTDMFQAVIDSYNYLTQNGLAAGSK